MENDKKEFQETPEKSADKSMPLKTPETNDEAPEKESGAEQSSKINPQPGTSGEDPDFTETD